jgi:hypothetical protein
MVHYACDEGANSNTRCKRNKHELVDINKKIHKMNKIKIY